MTLRLWTLFAVALIVTAEGVPLLTVQADKPPDPKELAAVQQIPRASKSKVRRRPPGVLRLTR